LLGIEDRIKESRKKAGFTQPQLAKHLGVSHRTVTTYEKDASKITVKMTQKIATECGVDEIWLLTGQGVMETAILTKEHLTRKQTLVNPFKDPDAGEDLIKSLAVLESLNPQLFEVTKQQVEIACKSAVDNNPGELSRSPKKSNG